MSQVSNLISQTPQGWIVQASDGTQVAGPFGTQIEAMAARDNLDTAMVPASPVSVLQITQLPAPSPASVATTTTQPASQTTADGTLTSVPTSAPHAQAIAANIAAQGITLAFAAFGYAPTDKIENAAVGLVTTLIVYVWWWLGRKYGEKS